MDIASAPATPGTPSAPPSGLRYKNNLLQEMSSKRYLCTCFSLQAWGLEDVPVFQKVAAEFIGSFILLFSAAGASIANEKTGGGLTQGFVSGASGLAITIVILSIGHISGAHVNPSVTIAFAAFRHFPWTQVPLYIGAQVLGSICAAFALKGIFHPFMRGGVTVPSATSGQAFLLEVIITFTLMFVVTAVATDNRAVGELAGIAVGATVMLNILIAGDYSGGSMNPIRTLGPAIAAQNFKALWVYIVAPITGAILGSAAYTVVRLKGDLDDESKPSIRNRR